MGSGRDREVLERHRTRMAKEPALDPNEALKQEIYASLKQGKLSGCTDARTHHRRIKRHQGNNQRMFTRHEPLVRALMGQQMRGTKQEN